MNKYQKVLNQLVVRDSTKPSFMSFRQARNIWRNNLKEEAESSIEFLQYIKNEGAL